MYRCSRAKTIIFIYLSRNLNNFHFLKRYEVVFPVASLRFHACIVYIKQLAPIRPSAIPNLFSKTRLIKIMNFCLTFFVQSQASVRQSVDGLQQQKQQAATAT